MTNERIWTCPMCGGQNFILVEEVLVCYTGKFKTVASSTGEPMPEWDDDEEGAPQIQYDTSVFESYDCEDCHESIRAPKLLEVG